MNPTRFLCSLKKKCRIYMGHIEVLDMRLEESFEKDGEKKSSVLKLLLLLIDVLFSFWVEFVPFDYRFLLCL